MTHLRVLYVCKLCGFVNCHHINYCPKCPGSMIRTEVEYPNITSVEILRKFCADKGWQYVPGISY